ncbi:MAG TPA: NrdH-like redox domain-containing protein [Geobacter sp.]|nr:NrdH-like redox domain-containing protein [Geobacter sp.]
MPFKMLISVLTIFLFSSIAAAEMYQWVDKNGVVTFKDTPPPKSKKVKKLKTYSDNDVAPAPEAKAVRISATVSNPTKPTSSRFSGTVEIYVTSWCRYCKEAQSYMSNKNIPFVAYDIEKDSAAKRRHQELGGNGVPLIVIGSNKMSGFSAEGLEHYLNNSR